MWIIWITSLAFPFVSHSVDRSKSSISWLLTVLVGAGTVLVVEDVSATIYLGSLLTHRGVDKTGLQLNFAVEMAKAVRRLSVFGNLQLLE